MATKEKATKKKAAVKADDGMIGTSEVAKRIGCDPKKLRTVLRGLPEFKGNDRARYRWKPEDKFLSKLPALIEEHTRQTEDKKEKNAAKKKATPKKAAKKTAPKKAAKKKPQEEVEVPETEETDETDGEFGDEETEDAGELEEVS